MDSAEILEVLKSKSKEPEEKKTFSKWKNRRWVVYLMALVSVEGHDGPVVYFSLEVFRASQYLTDKFIYEKLASERPDMEVKKTLMLVKFAVPKWLDRKK